MVWTKAVLLTALLHLLFFSFWHVHLVKKIKLNFLFFLSLRSAIQSLSQLHCRHNQKIFSVAQLIILENVVKHGFV